MGSTQAAAAAAVDIATPAYVSPAGQAAIVVMHSVTASYSPERTVDNVDIQDVLRQHAVAADERVQGKLRDLPPGSAGKKGGSNSARAGESGLVRLDIQMLTSWACRTDANMHGSDEFGRAESAACGTGQLDGGIDETGQPCMTFAASAAFVGQLAPEWTGNSDLQVPYGGAAIKAACQARSCYSAHKGHFSGHWLPTC